MKLKNTLVALILLAALGGVYFYLNKHPVSKPSDSTAEKTKAFSFQPSQVMSFTITAKDQPPLTIHRAASGSAWEIASPAGIPADNTQVQSFIDDLPKLELVSLESQTPAKLSEYSLDPPEKTFQFELTQGAPVTLKVGGENPSGYARYGVVSSTQGLFLLDTTENKTFLEKTLFDLRDKRIIPAKVDQAKTAELHFLLSSINAAEIERAKKIGLSVKVPKVVIAKQSNGNWEITEPAIRTDFGATNYFVSTINGGTMISVVDEAPKALGIYGLDRPAINLELTLPDGSKHSLMVGKKKEPTKEPNGSDSPAAYFAKNSDWPFVFTVNQTVFDQLNQDLDNYRNRYLFDFENFNARRLEIQGPTGELRLDRKGEDWVKGADGKTKIDSTKVDTFLTTIHSLRIAHYPEDRPGQLAAFGLDKPWMKVKVIFGESNKVETVVFGLKDKKFYATREGSPSVYELSPTEPDTIQPKLKDIS